MSFLDWIKKVVEAFHHYVHGPRKRLLIYDNNNAHASVLTLKVTFHQLLFWRFGHKVVIDSKLDYFNSLNPYIGRIFSELIMGNESLEYAQKIGRPSIHIICRIRDFYYLNALYQAIYMSEILDYGQYKISVIEIE